MSFEEIKLLLIEKFGGDVIGDDRDLVGIVGASECVKVGVVGQWIIGDEWRFPVAGRH